MHPSYRSASRTHACGALSRALAPALTAARVAARLVAVVGMVFGMLAGSAPEAGAQLRRLPDSLRLDLCYRQVLQDEYNGSYVKIPMRQLQNTAALYLTEILQGIVPGLVTRQSEGGIDDGGISMWVRGNRTMNGTTLTLVDGQERPIGMIAPEEIREIIVLKDAAATGLYGMRASRGAILINTRGGYAGKPRVEFSSQLTWQQPIALPGPVDAATYAMHHNIARISDGQQPLYTQNDINLYRSHEDPEGHPDVAWLEKYFRKGWMAQRYSFSVAGGSNVNRYFLALSWLHQPGMFNVSNEQGYDTNNRSDRYTLRTNIETNLSATTRLNVDIFGWFRRTNSPYTDDEAIYTGLTHLPANAFPEYYIHVPTMIDQDGNAISAINGKLVAGDVYHTNPWGRLNRSGYTTGMSMYSSLKAALRQELDFILPDLYLRAEAALDGQAYSRVGRTRSFAYYYPRPDGSWQKTGTDGAISTSVGGNNSLRYLTFNLRLEYSHLFGGHRISSAAFYEQFENADGTNIPNRVQSVCSYFSWNYDKRYGIDLTGAYQRWYGLPKGRRGGFFPTLSAGWTLSEEDFLKHSSTVTHLKLRGSIGHLGNYRGIRAFNYLGNISRDSNAFITGDTMENTLTGMYESAMDNRLLTFEKTDQANLGIDATLLKGKIRITADAFTDYRYDQFVADNRYSTVLGLANDVNVYGNLGSMITHGLELSASWTGRLAGGRLTISGNMIRTTDRVLSDGNTKDDHYYLNAPGFSYGRKLGYVVEGIFTDYDDIAAHATQTWSKPKPGDLKYRDTNGDGIVNTSDRVPIGYGNIPLLSYGLSTGYTKGRWSVNMLFQGAGLVSHSLGDADVQAFESYGTISAHQLNYWTPESSSAQVGWGRGKILPRTSLSTANANNNLPSTLTVVNASYLRLRRAEIAYRLPFKQGTLTGATFYIAGYNLLTFSPLKFKDPEITADNTNMPLTRNVCAGIRLAL